MLELISESLKIPNLPATVLLIIVILYWIINLLGLFDVEMFDADGGDSPAGSNSHTGVMSNVFTFGDLPITIVFSFFALFFWMGTILSNHYIGNTSLIIGLAIFVPNLILGFVLTKIIVIPLNKVYKLLNQESHEASTDFSGSTCIINIEADDKRIGQGEINNYGDSILVNIKSSEGKVLKKGQNVLLIEYLPEKGYYLAEPYEIN